MKPQPKVVEVDGAKMVREMKLEMEKMLANKVKALRVRCRLD